MAPPAEFDRKINDTHTQECLKRLLNLYLHRQTTPPCQGYSDETVQNSKDQSSGTQDLCSNLMKLELSSSDTGGIKDTDLSKQESITDSKIVDPMKDGTFLDSTIEDCIIQESRKYNTAVERGCKETVASDSTESARQCTCRQSEFVAAYLLYNLGNPEAVAIGYEWRPKLKSSYTFGVAMDICRAFAVRNYVRVLRLTGELPPLLLCAIHPHLDHVRRCQLKLMSHGYASKALKYPLSHLAQLLRCDDVTEAANLCQEYGLEVEGNSVRFSKAGFRESEMPPTPRPPSAWVSFQLAELPLQDLLLGPYCGCLNVYAS